MNYYSTPNKFTEITKEKCIGSQLRNDSEVLFNYTKCILIRLIEAENNNVKYVKSNGGSFHAINSTVDKILTFSGLQEAFGKREPPLKTDPHDNGAISCEHHSLLDC